MNTTNQTPAKQEHSPLPWKIKVVRPLQIDIELGGNRKGFIARVSDCIEGDCDYLLEACNNYERVKQSEARLLAACKKGHKELARLQGGLADSSLAVADALGAMQAAIAAVEGIKRLDAEQEKK